MGQKVFMVQMIRFQLEMLKKQFPNQATTHIGFPWMMGGVPSVHSAQNISDYYPPNYVMKAFCIQSAFLGSGTIFFHLLLQPLVCIFMC